jgi:putative transposase
MDAMLVPNDAEIRQELIGVVHDAVSGGHFGKAKTVAKLEKAFWWPRMHSAVAEYVETCPECQLAKPDTRKQAGLSVPIAVGGKNDIWALDYVGPMPPSSRGNNMILTITNPFTKLVRYVAVKNTITGKQTAAIFGTKSSGTTAFR